jgi:2-oxoglutarate ferredoxin oxidoreductase subunit beta
MLLALDLGATFVARSFSGDKEQLVPILKADLLHRGFAIVDVLSPCVTFNDHEGSTKSYRHARRHALKVLHSDFIAPAEEITVSYAEGSTAVVTMHDGSRVRFTKVPAGYDPTDRRRVYDFLMEHQGRGEIPTGLLFVGGSGKEMHEVAGTVERPLSELPWDALCPGASALEELQKSYR